MNNNVRRTRDPDISLMSPAGVLLDQTVLRASFRWNFYFRTPDINGSSRGLSFILSRLSLCNSFVRFARFACILLISRYMSETRPRRDGVVLLWHFNTYVHDDFLSRFFPGMLNFLIMRIFALQRKKKWWQRPRLYRIAFLITVSHLLGSSGISSTEICRKYIRFTSVHFWRFDRLIEIYILFR